jgi:hypothetical protein
MDFSKYCGHIKDEEMNGIVLASQPIPIAKMACGSIYGDSKKVDRVVHTDLLVKLLGKWPHLIQSISDCTAFGAAHAISILTAFNCLKFGEEWKNTPITELIYAGSRENIGRGRWRNTGGASGSATAECVHKLGTLPRGRYLNYDFSVYSGQKAEKLGNEGISEDLLELTKDHLVKTISLVTDTNTALDLLANYYPITIASNIGFAGRTDRNGRLLRDQDGCLKRGSSWAHQMCAVSFDRNPRRPKVGIANSWPEDGMTGPLDGLPEGCFWIDLDDFELILRQQDSFVYSDYVGFVSKPLNWRL